MMTFVPVDIFGISCEVLCGYGSRLYTGACLV